MPKSNMEAVAEAVRIVNSLDKRGRLVILRDLLKQDLEPKPKPGQPVTYREGGEK